MNQDRPLFGQQAFAGFSLNQILALLEAVRNTSTDTIRAELSTLPLYDHIRAASILLIPASYGKYVEKILKETLGWGNSRSHGDAADPLGNDREIKFTKEIDSSNRVSIRQYRPTETFDCLDLVVLDVNRGLVLWYAIPKSDLDAMIENKEVGVSSSHGDSEAVSRNNSPELSVTASLSTLAPFRVGTGSPNKLWDGVLASSQPQKVRDALGLDRLNDATVLEIAKTEGRLFL